MTESAPHPLPPRFLLPLMGLLAAALFGLDILTPLGVADGILYAALLLLGLWSGNPRIHVYTTPTACLLAIAGGVLHRTDDPWLLANRALMTASIVGVGALLHLFHGSMIASARAQAQAQTYLDIAGTAVIALDVPGRITLANRQACDLLGGSPDEIIGRDWFATFIPDGLRARAVEAHRQTIAGQHLPSQRIESPVHTLRGTDRFVAWRYVVIHGRDGAPTGTLASGEDITEQRLAAETLRDSLRQLQDLKFALDQASIVSMTDPEGAITYVNDRFCAISGYTREELSGQNHRIVGSGQHPPEVFQDLWATIRSGKVWRREICDRAKDGSTFWVDTTIVPLLGADGRPLQYLAIRSDVTARKKAEAELQRQGALAHLGQMAAVVAHEVKNPLAGISGAIAVIGERLPAGSPDREVVQSILARIDTLDRMVQDLLLFARPRPPRLATVELMSLLREAATLLGQDAPHPNVHVDVDAEPMLLQADAEHLKAALLNLLLNAAQAIGKGTVRLRARRDGSDIAVRVEDDGPGIDADALPRIFEPFFTTKHKGTGLGLPIARRIAEAHGGRLEIETHPGRGTTVTLRLPAILPAAVVAPQGAR